MAKYCGMIGFMMTAETAPGVDTQDIEERKYYGDILDDSRRWEASSEQVNDNFNIMNKISVIADNFITKNLHAMRYATFMGAKWKIKSVSVAYPRIILNLGDVYNG